MMTAQWITLASTTFAMMYVVLECVEMMQTVRFIIIVQFAVVLQEPQEILPMDVRQNLQKGHWYHLHPFQK